MILVRAKLINTHCLFVHGNLRPGLAVQCGFYGFCSRSVTVQCSMYILILVESEIELVMLSLVQILHLELLEYLNT